MSDNHPPITRDRTQRGSWWTLARRRWLYGIAVAAVPLAVSYGLLADDQAGALLALAAAVLGTSGMALSHPTEEK